MVATGEGVRRGIFDRRALTLIAIILLSEAAIAVLFFSLVQQYPAHLLDRSHVYDGVPGVLLRRAALYAGYALSAYGLAKLPGQPLSGWLADRYGPRRMLVLGLSGSLLCILFMAVVAHPALFVAACACYGLAVAVIWPAIYTLIGDRYAASVRGRLLAAVSGAQLAGSAGGFALGAALIDSISFAAAFAFAFALNAGALLLCLTRATAGSSHAQPSETGNFDAAASWLRRFRRVFSFELAVLCLILILISVAITLLAPDLKPYSANVLRLQYSTFALLLAFPALAAVLTLIPSGLIADRVGRTLPILLSVLLWSAAVLSLTFTRSVPLAIAFASVAAFAYALGLPAWSAALVDFSKSGSRGLQVGLAAAVQAIGLAVGPALGGELVSRFGTRAPFRVSAAIMLLAALLALLQHRFAAGREG